MSGNKDLGGHSVFIGQVRADMIDGKSVTAIEYSAYEGMVKVEADKIKEEVLCRSSMIQNQLKLSIQQEL